MRKAPAPPSTPVENALPKGWATEERTYRFLTPVFGGGVRVEAHKKHADPVTPVRVASIRGQLRFWWRACNPRKCATVEKLYEDEGKIFGRTSGPSALSIHVVEPPRSVSDVPVLANGDKFKTVKGMEDLAYGAFPLRDESGVSHGVLHKHTGDWRLVFQFPESLRRDVEAALWAWGHFGGLGGRTRRGFGAIVQVSSPLASIATGWADYVGGVKVDWPHLGPTADGDVVVSSHRCVSSPSRSASDDAHHFLLGKLRFLRQGTGTGRRQGSNGPFGRSFWPEPDAIRRLPGMRSSSAHRTPVNRVDKFPRAAFGMPVIFHFKDKDDPEQTTLLPILPGQEKPAGRLASPLILRPHQDGNTVTAMAVRLHHRAPTGVALSRKNKVDVVQSNVTAEEAAALGGQNPSAPSPFRFRDDRPSTDVIARYLEEIS